MNPKIGSLILGVAVVLIAIVNLSARKVQTNNSPQNVEMENQSLMMNRMGSIPGDSIPQNMMKNCMTMMNNPSMMENHTDSQSTMHINH